MKWNLNNGTGSKKAAILIVDDDPVIRNLMSSLLKLHYEVHAVEDVENALDRVQSQSYRLVITDYEMPGRNGLEAVEEIRKLSPFTQIIMVTGSDPQTIRERALSAGVHSFFPKPFKVAELLGAIDRAMQQTRMTAFASFAGAGTE